METAHQPEPCQLAVLPLWNPQIFTGLPFLAAGQASTFYPLSILFTILSLEAAYGWFTALQIALAGINMYIFGRVLGLRPVPAFFSGSVFMFSGFMIVSVVFTMFMAAVVWLPLLLAIIERIISKQEEKGAQSFRPIPYLVMGAAVIGVMILAGHPELIYYTMMVAGVYAFVRLIIAGRRIYDFGFVNRQSKVVNPLLKLSGWLLLMAVIGICIGAVQLLPLLELLPQNFREGSASLAQIREWAWPSRHILTFLLPDFFGNPSHHFWFDLWNGEWVPAMVNGRGEARPTIFWGIKNYVEGGNYVGIATWLLATVALIGSVAQRTNKHRLHTWFFAILALISLLFAFGTPLYAILYYGLPGWSQLHSPFRWVFPFTLSMAVLGGIGLQSLLEIVKSDTEDEGSKPWRIAWLLARLVRWLPALSVLAGAGALAVVCVSYFVPDPFVNLAQRVVSESYHANETFANGRMFWGYQALGLVRFGIVALLSGLLLLMLLREQNKETKRGGGGKRNVLPVILSSCLLVLLLGDLYTTHGNFNPASDVALSPRETQNAPPVVQFINEREEAADPAAPWRFTTFNLPGEKTFNANVGMYYGWHDIRGYDSTITKQYVDLMNHVAPQENELLYNRIAPLYSDATPDVYGILDNPVLDLLNVKYILTEHHIPNPSWQEVYRDEAIGAYQNVEHFPRTLIVPQARVMAVDEQPLLETNLRETLFVEERPVDENALVAASPEIAEAHISRYTGNDVFVDLNMSDRGWLLLTDAYFPGWKAYLRPFGGDEGNEIELQIYRANGAFRSVYVPEAGQWTVRFVYSPMSFKVGLYTSFMAAMLALFLLLWWGWGRYYRPETTEGDVRTVAKNSLVPMALNLTNKAIDFAFAMLYVRLLGPEGTGKYYFVVAIYGFFEIVSRYGLGTLLTRDVAADKNRSSRYLTNVLALRTLLWLLVLPVIALVTYSYTVIGTGTSGAGTFGLPALQMAALFGGAILFSFWSEWLGRMFGIGTRLMRIVIWGFTVSMLTLVGTGIWNAGAIVVEETVAAGTNIAAANIAVQSIGFEEVQAIAILTLAMLFANWGDALSNLFNAFEKMEYPAGLSSAMSLLKVLLGALVLILGWGFVGLAWISLVVNVAALLLLYNLLRTTLFKPEWHWDWQLQREMISTSGPLMINHLLATIFWRIDIWILRPLSAASVGLYSVGIKYMDGLNIIPSVFTMAVFPLMSRYAQRRAENGADEGTDGSDNLLRSYTISVRLLIMVSLPLAMTMMFLAEPLVWLVGGGQFVNHVETVRFLGREYSFAGGADLALQVIIWSIPIGFVNSVTQFVLIAVDQQRYLTKAFVLGVVFNTVGNLLLIPGFGYLGAAFVTILSEFSLLFPFYYSVKRHVGVVSWWKLMMPPLVSATVMGAAIFALRGSAIGLWLATIAGWFVYVAVLVVMGGFRGEDMAVVGRALPLGRLGRLLPAAK